MTEESKAEPEDTFVGRKVGGYTITHRVGQGGMGVVYEGRHERIGQRAAIKVLHKEMSADQKVLQRFFNEAKAISVAQHSGIVKIFDFGQLDDGIAFILMEFLEGETLLNRLERSQKDAAPLPLNLVIELALQLAEALALIHQKGIVHRDLKPENIFIVPDQLAPAGERVKLLDFGIAKFLDGPVRKTTVGMILGTPLYMSPEQCEGSEDLDAKVDVYALGVMLYEMIAGRLPFVADTAGALMRQHMFKEPPPLREQVVELPAALDDLVHSMLAKKAASRPSMTEISATLDQLSPRGNSSRDAPSIPGLSGLSLRRRQVRISSSPAATDPLAQTMGGASNGVAVTMAGPNINSGPVALARTVAAGAEPQASGGIVGEPMESQRSGRNPTPHSRPLEFAIGSELMPPLPVPASFDPSNHILVADPPQRRRTPLLLGGILLVLLGLGGLGLKLRSPGAAPVGDHALSGGGGPGQPLRPTPPVGPDATVLSGSSDGKPAAPGVEKAAEAEDDPAKLLDLKKKKRPKPLLKKRPGEETGGKSPGVSGKGGSGEEPDVWR